MNASPWRVGEILHAAEEVLAAIGPGPCWVTGTLSSWRVGRAYGWGDLFEHTADGRTQLARLPIAVPSRVAREGGRLLARSGLSFADGVEISVHGQLEIHPHFGPLRFLVDEVAAVAAPGATRELRRRLVAQLDAEGLLRANARQALPDRIVRIGLVVPVTGGAGRADFIGRLVASGGPFQVLEQRAATQGPDARVRSLEPLPGSAPRTCRRS